MRKSTKKKGKSLYFVLNLRTTCTVNIIGGVKNTSKLIYGIHPLSDTTYLLVVTQITNGIPTF